MPSQGWNGLLPDAVGCLQKLGYQVGGPVYLLSRNLLRCRNLEGEDELVLVQTRSHCHTGAYLMGLVVPALESAHTVFLWFRGEDRCLLAPAKLFRDVFHDERRKGLAGYASAGRQWRITVFPREGRFVSQGDSKRRVSLVQHMHISNHEGGTSKAPGQGSRDAEVL